MWQGIQMIMVDKTAPPSYDDNTDLLNELYKYVGWFKALTDTPVRKATPHHDDQGSQS